MAASFVDHFDVPWPCGYGSKLASLAQFGVYTAERMGAGYNPGYEVNPTLFLFDADGRVVWHDDRSRPRHLAPAAEVVRNVEAAIQKALESQ